MLGLAGESGSGKSTIGKAILGLLSGRVKSISGKLELCGRELLEMDLKQHREVNGKDIGYIMQNPMTAFNPCMKIKTHFMETICAHLPCSKKDAFYLGNECLLQVGLTDRERIMNAFPSNLSGGMLQRIMIALAISLNPVLIIADEPTTALDAKNREIVLSLLTEIIKKHRPAVLFISHDMEIIEKIADDVAIMQQGKIIEYGKMKDVFTCPKHPFTCEMLEAANFYMETKHAYIK